MAAAPPPATLEVFETTDADHGRVETRNQRVDGLFGDRAEPDAPRMPGRATPACVTGTSDDGPAVRPMEPLLRPPLSPRALARAVRSHLAIEYSLHRAFDLTFDENAARNRAEDGPANLAILRRLTRNRPRKARPELPVGRTRKRTGWPDAFARTVIGQRRKPWGLGHIGLQPAFVRLSCLYN